MTKSKSTKKALFSSVIALLVCFTMLLGTTYAWFTDSVTSSGNIIKAGSLDISLEHADKALGVDDEGWADASEGAIFNYSNWEPGYTLVKYVKIENEGSLDLRFVLNIVPNKQAEDVNLADVIEVYMIKDAVSVSRDALTTDSDYFVGNLTSLMNEPDGAAHGVLYADENKGNVYEIYTLALKMSTSAGNEYMNKIVGGGFSVQLLATQLASESDSFDDQYDKDADSLVSVSCEAELIAALAAGERCKLANDISVTSMVEVPTGKSAVIDGNGHTLTRADSYTGTILSLCEYAELTLSNVTLDGENVESTGNLIYIDSFGTLILNNGAVLENHVGGTTYENDPYRGPENSVIHCDGATKIVMNDGSVIRNNVAKGSFATVIASMYDLTCELNGGKIINNTSEKNNYTVNFGNYANVTVSDGFEAYGNTDGGLMRVNQQSTFTMNGGKLDGNGKSVIYTWVAKYVTLNGGEIVGNVSLNYTPATVGGTDVNGVIYKDKEVTKWAMNLTPDFGTVRYSIAGNITQLNIVPAEGYTYVAGDENKLICENTGYETYWDAESSCFKVMKVTE